MIAIAGFILLEEVTITRPNVHFSEGYLAGIKPVIQISTTGTEFISDIVMAHYIRETWKNVVQRGARIFKATIEDLLTKGMGDASQAILTGHSAGGLATILNCDRFRALFGNVCRVKCISDAGFFVHGKDLTGAARREGTFANVVEFHALAKFLPKSCTSIMDPGLAQILLKPVEPGWKNCIANLLLCTPAQIQALKDLRNAMLKELPTRDSSSRGMYIESCFRHGHLYSSEMWTTTSLKNKTIGKSIGDWYYDRGSFQEISEMTIQ